MELVLQVVVFADHVEHFDSGSSYHRRNGVGEQVRTRTLTQHVDDFLATGGESAHSSTESLAQGTGQDVHLATAVELFGNTATRLAYNTGRVAFVHHNQGIVFFSQRQNLVQRSHIAVHREHTVGNDDAETLSLSFFQAVFQFGHVAVGIAVTFSLAKTNPVDNRSVVQGIGNDSVLISEKRFEHTAVGIEAGRVQNSVFRPEEFGDLAFQFLVQVLGTADETDRTHAIASFVHGFLGGSNQTRAVGQAQVVVGAEVQNFLTAVHFDVRALRGDDHTFVFVKTGITNPFEFLLQELLKFSVHGILVLNR